MKAKHNLEEIKTLASEQQYWLSKTKALEPVVRAKGCTLGEAEKYISDELQKITDENFNSSIFFDGSVYDIYGKRIDGVPWYIKFTIAEDAEGKHIRNISFHPTEKELVTKCETLEAYKEAENE